ncbi:hypothetical protein JCM11251_000182 [Rhodosporidiobolus azoricus]
MDPSSPHQHRPVLNVNTTQQQNQQQGQGQQQYYHPTEPPFHIPDLSSQLADANSALPSSSPSSSRPPPPTSNLAAPSFVPPRSFSPARRAQSMKEPGSSTLSSLPSSSAGPPLLGYPASVGSSSVSASHTSEGSVLAGVTSGMDGPDGATTLARRNNTVSTASSRLVRLERTRARLALQGAGLSEEDQNFYVPPSPARGGPYALNAPWSDIGHGASSSTANLPLSGGGMAAYEGEQAWRRAEQLQQQQQQAQVQQQQPMANQAAAQQHPAQNEPKRSSFVVLRGGKGDAALTERRSHQPTNSTSSAISPPPTDSSAVAAADQPLRHKNSLKPFLEQERAEAESGIGGKGGEGLEDWEKGLMDERKSAAEGGLNGGAFGEEGDDWRNTDPYASLKTPPLSSSFPSQLSSPYSSTAQHARANTVSNHGQTRRNNTADPWLPSAAASGFSGATVLSTEDDPNLVRRHQSLNSFRQREPSIEQAMGVLSSSPGTASWADHSGSIDEHSVHHPLGRTASGGRTAYGSLALGAAPAISGFGSRTRSGTSPAPLMLHHSASLGHNAPARTSHTATAGLAHSTSLSSHPHPHAAGATGLSHSNSLGSRSDGGDAARRVISPVMNAFPGTRSPWSPTEEETKQLSLASSAVGGGGSGGSLSRGGSGSSRGSHATGKFADEVNRLEDCLAGMQLGPPGSQTPSSSSRAPSTSPQPLPPPAGNAARRLAPLMTGADVLLGAQGLPAGMAGAVGRGAGPASAAAFVPPIGHSHFFGGVGGLDGISENGAAAFPPPPQQQQQNGFGGPLPPPSFSQLPQQHQHQLPPTSFAPPIPPPPFPPAAGGFDPSTSAPPGASSLAPLRGNLTAHPGAPSSLDWARQKEFLTGATPTTAGFTAGPPSSAATIIPGSFSNSSVPPGATGGQLAQQVQQAASMAAQNGQNVDLASLQQQLQMQHVQQQQQINMLQSQMAKALSAMDAMRAQGAVVPPSFEAGLRAAAAAAGTTAGAAGGEGAPGGNAANAVAETPIDVNSLVAKKGYNPAVFDLRPQNARFFVIKSYTEEDVHKSLKYEIWASTDLGNKRLDRAFRESADKGPIYLFFSVNASGHFAGMAQMLTPVDYSMSSNVWASDKWKGVLKVRWIYIKDVPLSALRHIRLSNTPENKPVTSSRDTQEVPFDAGLEVLRIIASYQSRTSLLQDYAWYEASSRLQQQQQQQAQAAAQGGDAALTLPPMQPDVPLYQPGHHYQSHQQNQHNNHNNQPQGPPPHSTPSPQPPNLAPHQHQQGPLPPSPRQPQSQQSPKQAPRISGGGGRRFWGRGGGGGEAPPPVPPVPQQQQQGYYQAPPHLQQGQQQAQGQYPAQHVGNGMAY